MINKNIKNVIRQLKRHEISVMDVPEELRHNKSILTVEREEGLRIEGNRGYDAINGYFFVEEEYLYIGFYSNNKKFRRQFLTFESLEEYYDYLDGDIYNSACYRFCDFNKYSDFIRRKRINIDRLKERKSLIDKTIDDDVPGATKEELDAYNLIENNKEIIKDWIKKFNNCKTEPELNDMVDEYSWSGLRNTVDVSFFFYNYIYNDINDQNRFKTIMEYMSKGRYPECIMINGLCSIYGSQNVMDNYNYSSGSMSIKYEHKRQLRECVESIESDLIQFKSRYYFDKETHFYCEKIEGFKDGREILSYCRYFETFDEFIDYREGNLRDTDLSADIKLNVDLSIYEIDETTKLPNIYIDGLKCNIRKKYDNGRFYVDKEWKTKEGGLVKRDVFSTRYFFDFIHYLHGDLREADLLFCDGLDNLSDYESIDFSGARLTSRLCEKFNLQIEYYKLNDSLVKSFEVTDRNEIESMLAIPENMKGEDSHSLSLTGDYDRYVRRIYYITDLHLMHRLLNAKCRSKNDVIYVLQKIVNTIIDEVGKLLLIGGDISSDFTVFNIFINMLRQRIEKKRYGHTDVVFVLGNHELWDFPDKKVDEIVAEYRKVIEDNGMILLHNELLYEDSTDSICRITYDELIENSYEGLRSQLRSTRLVIFGGLGFSGYNQEFNANQGVYRSTLDRNEEIAESIKFEELYNRVVPVIYDKNAVILTHTPIEDWSTNAEPYKNLVYVNGHTHRNYFYDDGEIRIYSDNQIGYRNANPHTKSFLLDTEYDCFSDYDDGVYQITAEQYNDFYRGKNYMMSFNRKVHILYMLKKNGYYCFIHKSKKGLLSILNGGSLKRLDNKDINYYYTHMGEVISRIKTPLDNYMSLMKKISDEIKRFGGSGIIHGCIVDIDYFNHVYVNPTDLKITGYWAFNMIDKLVYPSIPSLLKSKCPRLYINYKKMIENKEDNVLELQKENSDEIEMLPKEYLGTDIYKASREIKKMQKLSLNILSSWYEVPAMEETDIKISANNIIDVANKNELHIDLRDKEKRELDNYAYITNADRNKEEFRQWLIKEKFFDRVIEKYIMDISALIDDKGQSLFEITSNVEIEEFINNKKQQLSAKERTALKYYGKFMKDRTIPYGY